LGWSRFGGDDAEPLECVACLLVVDGRVLAERRLPTKTLAPGAVAIPGGHVEPGERLEDALRREALEELLRSPAGAH